MKNIIISVIFFIILINFGQCAFALTDEPENITPYQQRIMRTGFRLLNSSLYEKRMTFFFENEKTPKVKIYARSKSISVTKGLLPFIDNDDELAAVLSTAIASVMDYQDGFFRRFSISFSPRKYQIKSDKKAVDIMVKAGYNPIGLLNIITKTEHQNNWFEYNIFSHNGSERQAYIYQYIYEKYPLYIAQNEYLAEYSYQNFLRTSKKDRKKTRLIQEHNIYEKIQAENKDND